MLEGRGCAFKHVIIIVEIVGSNLDEVCEIVAFLGRLEQLKGVESVVGIRQGIPLELFAEVLRALPPSDNAIVVLRLGLLLRTVFRLLILILRGFHDHKLEFDGLVLRTIERVPLAENSGTP